jgi:signal transduction histidine kinase
LDWQIEIQEQSIISNPNALSRIVYNLLSNACKYNTSNGFVKVQLKENQLKIINSSYGIKNPSKIFERFYKESDRGLGIGLHIVEKLCDELGIKKELRVEEQIVTLILQLKI